MKKSSLPLHALCICTSFLVTNLVGAATPTKPPVAASTASAPNASMTQRMMGMAKGAGQKISTTARNLTTKGTTTAKNLGTKASAGMQSAVGKTKNAFKLQAGKRAKKGAATQEEKITAAKGRQEFYEGQLKKAKALDDTQAMDHAQAGLKKHQNRATQATTTKERHEREIQQTDDQRFDQQVATKKTNEAAKNTIAQRNATLKPKPTPNPTTTENTAAPKQKEAETTHEATGQQTPQFYPTLPPPTYEEVTNQGVKQPSAPEKENLYEAIDGDDAPKEEAPQKP